MKRRSLRSALALALGLAACVGSRAKRDLGVEQSGGAGGAAAMGAAASGGSGGVASGGSGGVASGGQGGSSAAGGAGLPAAGSMATGGTMSAPLDAGARPDASDDAMMPGESPSVENGGADCAIPELPSDDALVPLATHHDPFAMLDGTRISKRSEWRCRRAEIKAQLEAYESGPKPVVAREDVTASFSDGTLAITVRAGDASVDFDVRIERPLTAPAGPAPLVIAFMFETLDGSVFADHGVATLVYDNDALGAQSGQGSRGNGIFYDLYGSDHPASSMVAWAWGVSRIIDALELLPEANVDPRRVAVTGCSRHGKGALLAGALDERIVLTIPQESGAGGTASWRVSQAQSAMGENVQTLSSAAGEQPWFRADFGQRFGGGNVTKLPLDHHMVMGLVAPRALLVIDNQIDWLGIDSSFTAGSIAHAIWEAFALPDRMGYWQTGGHTHCQFPAEQRAMLDAYVAKFLVGTGTADTNVLRADGASADLGAWMDWTPPALE